MLRGLPVESALVRAMDPEGIGQGWALDTHLIATLIEVSDETNQILAKVYGKKGQQTPKPLRIERPGRRTEKPKPLKGKDLAEALKRKMKTVGGSITIEGK